MSTATASQTTLTAEEFLALPDNDRRSELVAGRIIEMPPPGFRHGYVCLNIAFQLRLYLREHPRGRLAGNDAGVVTQRFPDSVRGPDVLYYSYERLPASDVPIGYPNVAPDLTFDVKSPSDSWNDLLTKVTELLHAGVDTVCLVDPDRQLAQVYRSQEPVRIVNADGVLEFPEILPGFRVALAELLA